MCCVLDEDADMNSCFYVHKMWRIKYNRNNYNYNKIDRVARVICYYGYYSKLNIFPN